MALNGKKVGISYNDVDMFIFLLLPGILSRERRKQRNYSGSRIEAT
jgi:hypothetical protein